MTKLRLLAFTSLSTSIAIGSFLVACSSDDTIVTTDSGSEAAADTSTPDTGSDTSLPDAGPDVVTDADAAPPFDGAVADFTQEIANSLCRTVARCCFGNADPPDGSIDGGSFDKAKCLNTYRPTGWEHSTEYTDQTDASTLVRDNQKAGDCLNGIENLACAVPGTSVAALRTACFEAFHGTVALNGLCKTSLDCAAGLFCDTRADAGVTPVDGGVQGKCSALVGLGGPCGDHVSDPGLKADEACSWRGQGGDQYCQIYSDFNAGTLAPKEQWKCEAAKPVNGDCNTDGWCQAAICSPTTFKCESPYSIFDSPTCASFVKK